jgi:glycine cleavage system H protein
LPDNPSLVNTAPQGEGWFFEITLSNPSELDGLMDEAAYQAHIGA